MLTDRPPKNPALLAQFGESDRLDTLELPQHDYLRALATSIETAMKSAERKAIRLACVDFLAAVAGFYGVLQRGVFNVGARE